MRNPRIQFLQHAAIAATAILVGGLPQASQAQDLQTINVMTANDTSCSQYEQFVMQELGFLEEKGYKLNLLSTDTSVPYVAFLSNGDADIVYLDAGQVLQAVNADQPIKVLYEVNQYAAEGIVVAAESPIQSLTDLKGKTVGLASDRDVLTTIIALKSVGLSLKDITTVVVGDSGPVLANALRSGQIDAFSGGATDRAGIEAAGLPFRDITPPEVSRNPGNSMVAWSPTLNEKRDMILAFIQAWAKSQHAGILEPTLVYQICKKYNPEQWENPATGRRIANNSIYMTHVRRTVDYGELQTDVWAAIQPNYIELGEIDREIDPAEFLDHSFIGEVNTFTTNDIKAAIAEYKADNLGVPTP